MHNNILYVYTQSASNYVLTHIISYIYIYIYIFFYSCIMEYNKHIIYISHYNINI